VEGGGGGCRGRGGGIDSSLDAHRHLATPLLANLHRFLVDGRHDLGGLLADGRLVEANQLFHLGGAKVLVVDRDQAEQQLLGADFLFQLLPDLVFDLRHQLPKGSDDLLRRQLAHRPRLGQL
jgi:hypothetical protein